MALYFKMKTITNDGCVGSKMKFELLVVVSLILFCSLDTHAQQQPSKSPIAAIIMLLLDESNDPEQPIELMLESTLNEQYGFRYGGGIHRDGLNIGFVTQSSDLILCFTAIDIQPEELSIVFNGQEFGFVVEGNNCVSLSQDLQNVGHNTLVLRHNNPGSRWGVTGFRLVLDSQEVLGLPTVNASQWNASAVRKVLKIFAFGGHATDQQIDVWASQRPNDAIVEMLNFSQHNALLSPLADGERYSEPATMFGTFREFAHDYLSQSSSNLPIPIGPYSRGRFNGSLGGDHQGVFVRMATVRGLNPFRQRIGLWETNYHLAVNLGTAVEYKQMTRFYDQVMEAHESGLSYQQVMATAAKSAAVALQYGHRSNQWRYDPNTGVFRCFCNDDFAREIHQLYFGIFGVADPDAHENITIRNTSKLLTGMNLDYSPTTGLADEIRFSTQFHHTEPLQILGETIDGATASEKIDNLFEYSMQHPESLESLPIKIIASLADDNLNEEKSNQLRRAWALMGRDKDFLAFIRAYAISTLFHSESQRKYLTSFERAIYQQNKITLDNTEALLQTDNIALDLTSVFTGEDLQIFYPSHNVFGGQTALEAANSAKVFQRNFNAASRNIIDFTRGASCSDCDFGQPWQKDWGAVIPNKDGRYVVDDVAEWLWIHIIGNLDNYTELERAHLIPIIGALNPAGHEYNEFRAYDRHFDLAQLLCIRAERILDGETDNGLQDLVSPDSWRNYCVHPYTAAERASLTRSLSLAELGSSGHVGELLRQIGEAEIPLAHANDEIRLEANRRIQEAVAFIFSTPFMFAEEKQ
ncbi:hypothetical protein NBRC116583_21140 [Arenicella sp. 4NH20-0111]